MAQHPLEEWTKLARAQRHSKRDLAAFEQQEREKRDAAASAMLAALEKVAAFNSRATLTGAFDDIAAFVHPDTINGQCDAVADAIAQARAAGIKATGE